MARSPVGALARALARSLAGLLALGIMLASVAGALGQGQMLERVSTLDGFLSRLPASQRQQLEGYLAAQTLHDFQLDKYWREVSDKRELRKRKKRAGQELTADDYVQSFPPEYKGPTLAPDLAKLWADHQRAQAEAVAKSRSLADKPKEPPKTIPTVADFLVSAKKHFGFVPTRIPEREFKTRYAREALAAGLTKAQVVRVYALETGGIGTAEMQAGIHPIRKTGNPISTALGYAQLLHANSINELARHGARFVDRLQEMAAAPGISPARAAELKMKRVALKRMVLKVRSVPANWDAHMRYASTEEGRGVHALNLDGDIGPWLQVIKLRGILEDARKAGRARLAPAEMELMNLAGPGTGLEMMLPVGRDKPTPNFFSRGGYSRNSIVRGRTAAELLAQLDKKMDENQVHAGAVEFGAAFDQLLSRHQAGR